MGEPYKENKMTTRARITVTDGDEVIHIYRHMDGYPDGKHGVLATLMLAFEYAWTLPKFEASDFSAAIIRAWKHSGGNVRILSSRTAGQHDVAWIYYIKGKSYGKLPIVTVSKCEFSTGLPTHIKSVSFENLLSESEKIKNII